MDHKHPGPAVPQDIVSLIQGAVPVHGDRKGAQDARRLADLEEGEFVPQAEGDGVALPHAQALQPGGGSQGARTDRFGGRLAIAAPQPAHGGLLPFSGDAITTGAG